MNKKYKMNYDRCIRTECNFCKNRSRCFKEENEIKKTLEINTNKLIRSKNK